VQLQSIVIKTFGGTVGDFPGYLAASFCTAGDDGKGVNDAPLCRAGSGHKQNKPIGKQALNNSSHNWLHLLSKAG
jgi:hypothetical protein